MEFLSKDYESIRRRLDYPTGRVRVVIDTDAYNEVDDQFAIAWALRSPERMDVEAVYAAPFCSLAFQHYLGLPDKPMDPEAVKKIAHFAATPADGMEQSYQEIRNLFTLLGEDGEGRIFRGSPGYLTDKNTPVESAAARDLVARAMSSEEPLYVLAIGAITNVASALLMEPRIARRMVVVWLGGQPLHFPQTVEFNLMQDVKAAQVLLDSGVPLVLIPCMTVASQLAVSAQELKDRLDGRSKVGSYLTESVLSCFHDETIPTSDRMMKAFYLKGLDDIPAEVCNQFVARTISWSRIIWDISTVGWLMSPNWCLTTLTDAPILNDDLTWSRDDARHPIRICNYISRDHIFGDMFAKLSHD